MVDNAQMMLQMTEMMLQMKEMMQTMQEAKTQNTQMINDTRHELSSAIEQLTTVAHLMRTVVEIGGNDDDAEDSHGRPDNNADNGWWDPSYWRKEEQ